MSTIDERFMRVALDEARAAAAEGEVPVGAVVVQGGQVIARAHNRREAEGDPSAHAEFRAIVAASRLLGRWRLSDCTVYVTLEPCAMCAGLMVNSRIGRCVYGAADPKAGALGSLYWLHADARLNHAFAVRSGVLEAECAGLLREFFAGARARRERDKSRAIDRIEPAACECCEPVAVPALHVLLAVDSFKGSATSAQAEAWLAQGVRRAMPNAQVTALPIADGGEGTVDAVYAARGGSWCELEVQGPCGGRHRARYLLVEGATLGGEPTRASTAAGGGGLVDAGEPLGAGAAAGAGVSAGALAYGSERGGVEGPVRVSAAAGPDTTAGAGTAAGSGAAVGAGTAVDAGSAAGAGTAAGVSAAVASIGGRQAPLPSSAGGAARQPFAVIEMAEAAGIGYSPCTLEAALGATTYGVGELILDAVARGARELYVGLGGSATNDGGAGMLQALGARLLDGEGRPIPPGLRGLARAVSIDLAPAVQALDGARLMVLTDVTNPLVGPRGALATFGPQKGLRFEASAAGGNGAAKATQSASAAGAAEEEAVGAARTAAAAGALEPAENAAAVPSAAGTAAAVKADALKAPAAVGKGAGAADMAEMVETAGTVGAADVSTDVDGGAGAALAGALGTAEAAHTAAAAGAVAGSRGLAAFAASGAAGSLDECDRWMRAYAAKLTAARDALDGTPLQVGAPGARPKQLASVPGAGAAGGLGAAYLALGARLTSGIEALLDLSGFDEAARAADLVITGEGNMDAQTAAGKAPVGVAARAKAANPRVPVVAVCGGRADELEAVYEAGIDAVLPIVRRPMDLEEALSPEQTRANLIAAGESIARFAALTR